MLKRKVCCILLAVILVISNIGMVVYAEGESPGLELGISEIKELVGKSIAKLSTMSAFERSTIALNLKFAINTDFNIDELVRSIEEGNSQVFEPLIQSLLNSTDFTREMIIDVVKLIKVFDEEQRQAYINKWNNKEMVSPIEEELDFYHKRVEEYPGLQEIMRSHDVKVGNFITLIGIINELTNNQPLLTDDPNNLNYFAYINTAIPEEKKSYIDEVLSGYMVNGELYSDFDTMFNSYLAKLNNLYSEQEKILTDYKVILARHGLYTPTLEKAEEMVEKVEGKATRNNARKAQYIVDALAEEYAADKQELNNRIADLNIEAIAGDITGDNLVNVMDVILLLNYIVDKIEFSEIQSEVADVTGDGNVNVLDAIKLLNIIVNTK